MVSPCLSGLVFEYRLQISNIAKMIVTVRKNRHFPNLTYFIKSPTQEDGYVEKDS